MCACPGDSFIFSTPNDFFITLFNYPITNQVRAEEVTALNLPCLLARSVKVNHRFRDSTNWVNKNTPIFQVFLLTSLRHEQNVNLCHILSTTRTPCSFLYSMYLQIIKSVRIRVNLSGWVEIESGWGKSLWCRSIYSHIWKQGQLFITNFYCMRQVLFLVKYV